MSFTPEGDEGGVGPSSDSYSHSRERALEKTANTQQDFAQPLPLDKTQILLEDLRIHQLELQMQNEELRRVQADLELSRARYFDLYNLSPAGYLTVSSDGSIREANLRASALLATTRSLLLQRKFIRYISAESQDVYRLAVGRVQRTSATETCKVRMLQDKGPQFWALLSMSQAAGDEKGGCRIVMEDISEQQRLEEALRQANAQLAIEKAAADNANRAKGLFLSSMSHEIRTPLNGVIGMSGLLMQTDLNAEQLSYARIVTDSATALLGLVNNILDFSKIEAGQLQLEQISFDLEDVIEDVLHILSFKAQEKSLETACWYATEAPRQFIGDSGRIRQILTNFISNAIKFTPSGYVLVEVDISPPADDICTVKIAVHDTGIGIAKSKLPQLFTRFRQADPSIARVYGGTGLGLSIVKQIVELMRGQLAVNSIEGQGSTFSCQIPLRVAAEQPRPTADIACLSGLSVVVSGSQQICGAVISEWCRRWGMQVERCAIGDLRDLFRQGSDSRLVIVDAGTEALLANLGTFRSHIAPSGTKLLLLTPDNLEPLKILAADAVLPTPVRSTTLAATLSGLVLGSSQSPKSSPPQPVEQAIEKTGKLKILVTDDNLINQKLACVLLSKLGREVDTANDGLEAVNKIRQGAYELVFMDCVMPVMDGYVATRAIRHLAGQCARVPIVALTASATQDDRDHCFAVGMNDFLTKPIRSEELMACLVKWAGK